MSVTQNAKSALVKHSGELLELFEKLGVDIKELRETEPEYKAVSENGKAAKKRWRQQHPEKCKEYVQKYMATDKGQALRERNAEKEKTHEKRAVRKAYRDKPENKARMKEYQKQYNEEHREEKRAKSHAYYEANK